MKGLLLKDFYMTIRYCRAYLLMIAVFVAVSFVGQENLFFVFFPCMISGMLPVTLLAYDERSKWSEYCRVLPYSKAQIVSGKYLVGLIAQLAVLCVTGTAQALRMQAAGMLNLQNFGALMGLLLILSSVASSLVLPFMFRYGVEKGRIAYYVMIGIVTAGGIGATNLFGGNAAADGAVRSVLPLLCAAGVMLYALSWVLSIAFYKKQQA